MIGYASNTGTRRNLAALRAAGWRILLTPRNPKRPEGFRVAIDNGAWGKDPFDPEGFMRLVDREGGYADFVVVPDIVAGGLDSLRLSLEWLPRLRALPRLLLPMQDGMEPSDVGPVLEKWPNVGLFLGGSTEWKLARMYGWGMVAHAYRRYYHIGRVNSARRIRLSAEAGADSFDGTSASMYSCTVPELDAARRQPSLLIPARWEVTA